MRLALRLFVTVSLFVATLAVAPPHAEAATSLSVGVVQTTTARNTRHYLSGVELNGGGMYEARVDHVVNLMKTEFRNVGIIDEAALASPSTLAKYDVLVFPRTLAMTAAQRSAVLQYVACGGGVVGSFGMSRWTPDSSNKYGYKPFLGMSYAPGVYQWPPSSDGLKVWEWGDVSEMYGVRFSNDDVMYATWQAVGKSASSHWILSQTAKDIGKSSVTLNIKQQDNCEAMVTLPGATGVTPLLTFGTRKNSTPADDAYDGTLAAMANEYYFGRFVYYGFQLHDTISFAYATTADQLAAQRLLVNSVTWAASSTSFRHMNKNVALDGTAWQSGGTLNVKPTVSNVGNISLRGPLTITVYTPSGSKFGTYQAYSPHQVPLPPGSAYTHGSFQVPVGTAPTAGTWKVRVSYRHSDYFHGGTAEWSRDLYLSSNGHALTHSSTGPLVVPSGSLKTIGTQIAGSDRYRTSVELSEKGWPNGVSESRAVILATGANFPDALAASPLAGNLNAPVLLIKPAGAHPAVSAELKRLYANKTSAVLYIMGGSDVVPDAVVAAYKKTLVANGTTEVQIKRLEGNDRYGTALAIAKAAGAPEDGTFADTAFIVSGLDYPDALAIGPLAAAEGVPILPVKDASVPSTIQRALKDLGIKHCVIMGGSGAVSTTVETWLEKNGYRVSGVAAGTNSVDTRLGGSNRYSTGLLAVNYSVAMGKFNDDSLYLATGANWPDALALAPVAGLGANPLMLVDGGELGKSSVVANYLIKRQADAPSLAFVGGDGAVTPYVRGQIRVALDQ